MDVTQNFWLTRVPAEALFPHQRCELTLPSCMMPAVIAQARAGLTCNYLTCLLPPNEIRDSPKP
eukprot:780218-Rhodomonas_salina.1